MNSQDIYVLSTIIAVWGLSIQILSNRVSLGFLIVIVSFFLYTAAYFKEKKEHS